MQIIYFSNCFSDEAIKKIHDLMKGYSDNAPSKFHRLIIEGLVNNGADVHAVSFVPINRRYTTQKKIILENDEQNGVKFHYLKAVNKRFINNIYNFFQLRKKLNDLYKQNKDLVIIYDILRLTSGKAILGFCKKTGVKCYGIVTDVPLKRASNRGFFQHNIEKILYRDLQKCNGYIFMTKQMNEFINTHNKPWCLIECICDGSIVPSENTAISDKKVCVYAGLLHKVYGIDVMIEGFLKANIPNAVLKLFGAGDYLPEIKKIAQTNSNIEYCGLVPNDVIVEEEKKATLLVNPRPNIGEFTKYSFPSKTLEYMASGTPMAGFKLDGIPDEYFDYIYTFNDYTAESFCETFKNILSKDENELRTFGKSAQEFVLKNKNNTVLAKRIIDLILPQ